MEFIRLETLDPFNEKTDARSIKNHSNPKNAPF